MFLIDKQEGKEIDELLCGAVYRAAPLRVAREGSSARRSGTCGWAKRFIRTPSFRRKLWRGKNAAHEKSADLPLCAHGAHLRLQTFPPEWRDAQAPDALGGTACTELLDRAERRAAHTWTACRAFGTARAQGRAVCADEEPQLQQRRAEQLAGRQGVKGTKGVYDGKVAPRGRIFPSSFKEH